MRLAQDQTRSNVSEPLPWVAVAKFSLEDENEATFRSAAQTLSQNFPEHQYSHYFQGIMALKDANWKTAERELRKAKESGIPDESIAHWLKIAIDNQRWI